MNYHKLRDEAQEAAADIATRWQMMRDLLDQLSAMGVVASGVLDTDLVHLGITGANDLGIGASPRLQQQAEERPDGWHINWRHEGQEWKIRRTQNTAEAARLIQQILNGEEPEAAGEDSLVGESRKPE